MLNVLICFRGLFLFCGVMLFSVIVLSDEPMQNEGEGWSAAN